MALRVTVNRGRRCASKCATTGPGFPPGFSLAAPGNGHGLRNIAERLSGYYGDSARISWENAGGRHDGPAADSAPRRGRRDRRKLNVMRVLIVDDEAPARARLRQMLAAHADLEIAGEAETGVQAMEMAVALRPDLLLLDIQMPGSSGIDVAACLSEPRPHVIFCTAYDQHAVDAFELHAVDYLLKPISRARLAQALDRVRALDGGRRRVGPRPGDPRQYASRPAAFW